MPPYRPASRCRSTSATPSPPLMKGVGYGQGYRYIHDDPAAQREMPCLPERFQGRDYLRRDRRSARSSN